MPPHTFEQLTNWAQGVVTSASPDDIPDGASPRGRNTQLKQIGEGTAAVGTRRGASVLTPSPVTGSPRLWGTQFRKTTGTTYNLLVSDTGRLDVLNGDGSTTVFNTTAFTSGDHPPVFVTAEDLCFIVNDVDQKKFDGTSLTALGITRPEAPTATAAAGGSTMATGDWDIALTYYNSLTGHQSSRSDYTTVSLTSANRKVSVSWPAPTDTQVTHVRVHARRQTTGQNAYLVVSGATPAPDSTTYGYLPATLATSLEISDTVYQAFITLTPNTVENDPPASGLHGPCWHASRLFLHDTGNVYYSKVQNNDAFPEAFAPSNIQPINPDDGDEIIALCSFKERLYIFKRFSMWALTGTDPNSWSVDRVSASFGCASRASLVEADGALYWWTNSHLGLAAYDGSEAPAALGQRFIAETVNATALNLNRLDLVVGAVDEANATVLMAVPGYGSTRNTLLIPFNYRLRRFPAEWWNPFDVNALWVVETSEDTKAVYMGGYAGQVFQWWAAAWDGVPSTSTTSGTVTSATSTTLTSSAAAFTTTGGALIDRYVYALSSDTTTVQRRRITSNTATVLTVTPAWDSTPNSTHTYVVGGIDFQSDTRWVAGPSAFVKKRFEFLLAELFSTDVSVPLTLDLFVSRNDNEARRTFTTTLNGAGGVYDTSLFDAVNFATSSPSVVKQRCGCTGTSWKARVRLVSDGQDITLTKIAMQAIPMSIKR